SSVLIAGWKSGATAEPLSPFACLWGETKGQGRQFAALTDPGSGLEKLAKENDFRWIFPNPPDIGGRYSALSYFGLVPGALMGINVVEMRERATEMAQAGADS